MFCINMTDVYWSVGTTKCTTLSFQPKPITIKYIMIAYVSLYVMISYLTQQRYDCMCNLTQCVSSTFSPNEIN